MTVQNRKKTGERAKKATPSTAVADRQFMEPHEVVMSPAARSATGIYAWSKFAGDANISGVIKNLSDQIGEVRGGDMRSVEAMLYGQATTLDTIFTSLARRATSQEYLKQFQMHLSLALKAQAQSRATLEALAEIKNPRPVSFVKQANISGGHQQVNNGQGQEIRQVRAGAHAEGNRSLQNGLLEAPHGNKLDTGAQSTAGRADRHLETVDAGHRAAHT